MREHYTQTKRPSTIAAVALAVSIGLALAYILFIYLWGDVMTYTETQIAYEKADYWVLKLGFKGFEVYRNGITHSTRCAVIGYQGEKGLSRAIAEIDRRLAQC